MRGEVAHVAAFSLIVGIDVWESRVNVVQISMVFSICVRREPDCSDVLLNAAYLTTVSSSVSHGRSKSRKLGREPTSGKFAREKRFEMHRMIIHAFSLHTYRILLPSHSLIILPQSSQYHNSSLFVDVVGTGRNLYAITP